MQCRVMCNSLCGVKVNIMEGRPLVAIGQKVTDWIRYTLDDGLKWVSKYINN